MPLICHSGNCHPADSYPEPVFLDPRLHGNDDGNERVQPAFHRANLNSS